MLPSPQSSLLTRSSATSRTARAGLSSGRRRSAPTACGLIPRATEMSEGVMPSANPQWATMRLAAERANEDWELSDAIDDGRCSHFERPAAAHLASLELDPYVGRLAGSAAHPLVELRTVQPARERRVRRLGPARHRQLSGDHGQVNVAAHQRVGQTPPVGLVHRAAKEEQVVGAFVRVLDEPRMVNEARDAVIDGAFEIPARVACHAPGIGTAQRWLRKLKPSPGPLMVSGRSRS